VFSLLQGSQMRSVVLFAGFLFANAEFQNKCAINGARAVDDMVDAAVFIWAATKRCDTSRPNTEQDPVRCALNIASAIESANSMFNVVLKAFHNCGELQSTEQKCGMAIGVLTKSFSGLAASSAGIVAKCPNALNHGKALMTYGGTTGSFANPGVAPTSALGGAANAAAPKTFASPQGLSTGLATCVVNMKDSLKAVMKAIKRSMTINRHCKGTDHVHCTHNILKVTASVAAIGEYIAGAIGKCTIDAGLATKALCSQESIDLVQSADECARSALYVHKYCQHAEDRLYEIENGIYKDHEEKHSKPQVTTALAALLPVAAIVGFLSGKRVGKSGRQREDLQDMQELEPVSLE